jgi:hypothetical protein
MHAGDDAERGPVTGQEHAPAEAFARAENRIVHFPVNLSNLQ